MVWVHWGAEVGAHLAGGARISSKKLARGPRIGPDRLKLLRFGPKEVLGVGGGGAGGVVPDPPRLSQSHGRHTPVAAGIYRGFMGCEFPN